MLLPLVEVMMLILLDLSVFFTQLITIHAEYFLNRTQRVQINNVLSDFANIICGVPQ